MRLARLTRSGGRAACRMFDLKALVHAFAGVRYVLIGGVAMSVHASAIVTQDFDIVYDRTPDNMRRIVKALERAHPKLRGPSEPLPFALDERTLKNGLNFTLATDMGDVDLLGHVAGFKDFDDVVRYSEHIKVFGVDVDVLGLEGLIIAKRAAARTKDLAQLPELEALLEAQEQE